MRVRLVISGRGYSDTIDAPESIELPEGSDISAFLAAVRDLLGESATPPYTLIAVNGQHLGAVAAHDSKTLNDGDEVVLLAPVAGG